MVAFSGFAPCLGRGSGSGEVESSARAVKAEGGDGEAPARGVEVGFGELDAFVRAGFGEAVDEEVGGKVGGEDDEDGRD